MSGAVAPNDVASGILGEPPPEPPSGEPAKPAPNGADPAAPSGQAPAPAPVSDDGLGLSGELGGGAAAPESTPLDTSTDEPSSLDGWLERYPALKEPLDMHVTEKGEEVRREAQSTFDKRNEHINSQVAVSAQQSNVASQHLGAISARLTKLGEDGAIDGRVLAQAMQMSPDVVEAMKGTFARTATFASVQRMTAWMGESIGGDLGTKFIEEFSGRWHKAEQGFERSSDVSRDMMTFVQKELVDKAVKPYKDRVRTLEAAMEGKKLETREGEGPGHPPESATQGAGVLDADRIAAMSDSEYEENRPAIMAWQSSQFGR